MIYLVGGETKPRRPQSPFFIHSAVDFRAQCHPPDIWDQLVEPMGEAPTPEAGLVRKSSERSVTVPVRPLQRHTNAELLQLEDSYRYNPTLASSHTASSSGF